MGAQQAGPRQGLCALAPAPTDEALQTVLHKIIARLMKPLTRRGVLVEVEGSTYMAPVLQSGAVPAGEVRGEKGTFEFPVLNRSASSCGDSRARSAASSSYSFVP